ncbi:hypothetical protein R4P71_32845 [Rhodococcus sp. IEGM 1304]|uniref:hypothetical protein n=1 Tax=Rhodococcus sp. IEGM 1304 TaxID=3082227 RepID=UPI00295459D4|nr:hypothetical protein [Rhodococcus sp. IEGM 1304]MDV8129332.1 hypothetical protein [Rhodococcus sp. IEGM 1304]
MPGVEVAAEFGEHGAGALGVVARREIGAEVAEPVRWILQCGSEIRCSYEYSVRRTAPAGSAASGTSQSGSLPAVDTGRVRVRWAPRPGAKTTPAGGGSQRPPFPAAWARGTIDVRALSPKTVRAQVPVDEEHRCCALPAGA